MPSEEVSAREKDYLRILERYAPAHATISSRAFPSEFMENMNFRAPAVPRSKDPSFHLVIHRSVVPAIINLPLNAIQIYLSEI